MSDKNANSTVGTPSSNENTKKSTKGKNYVVYLYEVKNDYEHIVYVGLTNSLKRRHLQHCTQKDTVSKGFAFWGIPEPRVLEEKLTAEEAQYYEGYYIEKYRNIEGCTVLNKAKAGALGGGNEKWTYETCKEEASKYSSRSEFEKNCTGAYKVAHKNGWLDDFFGSPLVKRNYWNYETCKETASKYSNRRKFSENCGAAYQVARKNGWLDDFFGSPLVKCNYWNYETCKEEASKYSSRWEFGKDCPSAYDVARKNGWLDEFFPPLLTKPMSYWNHETCKEEASKYSSRWEFKRNCPSAYDASRRKGWLDEFFDNPLVKYNYWNYETCKIESSLHTNRTSFHKNCSGAYKVCLQNGWLDEFFPKNESVKC